MKAEKEVLARGDTTGNPASSRTASQLSAMRAPVTDQERVIEESQRWAKFLRHPSTGALLDRMLEDNTRVAE